MYFKLPWATSKNSHPKPQTSLKESICQPLKEAMRGSSEVEKLNHIIKPQILHMVLHYLLCVAFIPKLVENGSSSLRWHILIQQHAEHAEVK